MHSPTKKSLIYLTGFMGSGKSTIAPILANTIGYKFLDIDKAIEEETGKRVSEIFSDEGEAYFRGAERRILASASADNHLVVSLGGGTITNPANLSLVKSSGILVFLKTDTEQIFQRVKYKEDRPLLKSADGTRLTDEELLSRVKELLAAREPFYSQADIVIETGGQRVGITVDQIVRRLSVLID
jgi:shikimate kinase